MTDISSSLLFDSIRMLDNSTNLSAPQFTFETAHDTNRVKFVVLLSLQIVSISCYLFIFYNFATNRNLRQSIHNNSIRCLLTISFLFVLVPLSISESFLHKSYIVPGSNLFCGMWNWFQYSLDVSNLHLMAYASIERHLLIFHSTWMRNKWNCRLFHYFPLIFSIAYPSIFYFIVIFFVDCQTAYDFTQLLCTWPCYFDIWPLTIYDVFFNTLIPLLVVPICSAALFARVLWQKRTMRLEIFKWKRDRKMTRQLLGITLLYLLFWLPSQVFGLMNTFYIVILPQLQSDFIDYFVVFVHLLFPFVCLLSYSEMLKQICRRPIWRARRIIQPTAMRTTERPHEMVVRHQTTVNPQN